jgi:hypothetical protein
MLKFNLNPFVQAETMRQMSADFDASSQLFRDSGSSTRSQAGFDSDECIAGDWGCEPVSSFYKGSIADDIIAAQSLVNTITGVRE